MLSKNQRECDRTADKAPRLKSGFEASAALGRHGNDAKENGSLRWA